MSEKELKLFEVAMDLAVGECCSDNVEDIKRLETKIKLIDDLYKQQKEVIDKVKNVQIEMPKSNYSYDYMIYRSKIDEILKEVSEWIKQEQ